MQNIYSQFNIYYKNVILILGILAVSFLIIRILKGQIYNNYDNNWSITILSYNDNILGHFDQLKYVIKPKTIILLEDIYLCNTNEIRLSPKVFFADYSDSSNPYDRTYTEKYCEGIIKDEIICKKESILLEFRLYKRFTFKHIASRYGCVN